MGSVRARRTRRDRAASAHRPLLRVAMRDARHRVPVVQGPRCRYPGPPRWPGQIRLVVVHDTEGNGYPKQPPAMGVARYGASSAARASWHFTVDQKEAVRCLPDDVVGWAAPGANTDGLQLEICGYARWSRLAWYRHQATLKRSAWVVARWCVRYGIPVRWLTDRQLSDRASEGLATHVQCSRVFKGSDHTDPGPNFPADYFLWLVKRRVRWLQQENQ